MEVEAEGADTARRRAELESLDKKKVLGRARNWYGMPLAKSTSKKEAIERILRRPEQTQAIDKQRYPTIPDQWKGRVVREMDDGRRFYDHFVQRMKKPAGASEKPKGSARPSAGNVVLGNRPSEGNTPFAARRRVSDERFNQRYNTSHAMEISNGGRLNAPDPYTTSATAISPLEGGSEAASDRDGPPRRGADYPQAVHE